MNALVGEPVHVAGAAMRPLLRSDRKPLAGILGATGVFGDDEIAIALELIDAVLDKPDQQDYIINVYQDARGLAGYYCLGPTPATAGTFDLYWIAVDPNRHGQGIGSQLMLHAEALVRAREGRLIIVETSSRPAYEPTRRFYRTVGYEEIAHIAGYYRPGDDLVVFGKYVSQ
ncbi:MAG: GNAT family N-acetyltransferase [Bacteroidota bacterium]